MRLGGTRESSPELANVKFPLVSGGGDPRRKRFDLRERQGEQPFGLAEDMIMLLAQALLAL
jgi:hypothetical protein